MRFGEPVFGMMNQPFTREKFSGDGGATRYRGPAGTRDLHVRPCAAIEDAILSTTSPLLMNKADRAAFGRLEKSVKLSRYGGDCYAYCMLAAGLIDLVIETEIKPYDIVAIIPIVTGAGGIVTTWENGPAQGGGRIIVRRRRARARGSAGDAGEGLIPRRAGHEGVERRPELGPIVILLLQNFMLGAGQDEMASRQADSSESLDRRRRDRLRRGRPRPSRIG